MKKHKIKLYVNETSSKTNSFIEELKENCDSLKVNLVKKEKNHDVEEILETIESMKVDEEIEGKIENDRTKQLFKEIFKEAVELQNE